MVGEASAKARTISPREKRKVPFSMGIGNGELMHECFPKHSGMGTVRIKKIKKQTNNVRREEFVWKEAKRARTKEVPTAYHILTKIQ